MSDTAIARGPDLTSHRRNPGVGLLITRSCARCSNQGSGAGWAVMRGLMHCPACREKQLARKAKK